MAGHGKVENTIRLHNQHYWEIRNLTVTNTDGGDWDDEGRGIRRAIYVTAEDAGDVEHIHLQNLEIRDVRGMYRFTGHETNGGIICQVTGKPKKTRFVDLQIEGCTFRTKSIDRYPVVVTSSWKTDPPCEVVWKDNTFDHAGRAHIVIPADHTTAIPGGFHPDSHGGIGQACVGCFCRGRAEESFRQRAALRRRDRHGRPRSRSCRGLCSSW